MTAPVTIVDGQKFGEWSFLHFVESRGDKRVARCQCSCGAVHDIYLTHLRTGKSTKCKQCYTVRHDMHGTPTYRTWRGMMVRCYNKASKNFQRYGARGIAVCPQWQTFEGFFADMGERPEGTTLDRWPNNDGNYEPGNCRWATLIEQANNTSTNKRIEHQGQIYTGAELARHLGISYKTLMTRLRRGAALNAPLRPGFRGVA